MFGLGRNNIAIKIMHIPGRKKPCLFIQEDNVDCMVGRITRIMKEDKNNETNERMHLVAIMMEGLESSVTTYCEVKEKKGRTPFGGYDISREDCKESIKRRITLIREELLNIGKEL